MIHRQRFNVAIYLAMLVTLCDQLSKWWVVHEMAPPPSGIVVTWFFNLVLIANRGATFGLLSRFDPQVTFYFLIATATIILALLGRWLWRTNSTGVSVGLGLVIGGAVGNLIDRLRFGAVIDFLDFHFQDYHWYAFNVADSAIVTGVAILLLDGLIRPR